MQYNKSPISLREGRAYVEGVEVYDAIKMEIKFTPDIWTGRQLGERSPSSRWLGYTSTGSMTRRRATKWLQDAIKKYLDTGLTPEFTIQGIMDDPNSDYQAANGPETVTAVGCVPSGDFLLMALDSEATGVLEDVVNFNIKDIV